MDRHGKSALDQHYARPDLITTILEGLRAAGKDPMALTVMDLAPVDQIHTLGPAATRELMELAEISANLRVLDVGGGLGGPARQLAEATGCAVTVLDLTPAYVRAGEELTARTGLSDRVRFQVGDATAMPFPDASFDVVWLQHATMNIADKAALLREVHRVLVPGGRLALHEVTTGSGGLPYFPAGWAPDARFSFLIPPEELRALLRERGFRERAWIDTTAQVRQVSAQAAAASPPSPLSLALVFGSAASEVAANSRRNIAESRVTIIQALAERG